MKMRLACIVLLVFLSACARQIETPFPTPDNLIGATENGSLPSTSVVSGNLPVVATDIPIPSLLPTSTIIASSTPITISELNSANVSTFTPLWILSDVPEIVYAVDISPDGTIVALGGKDDTIGLYSVETGERFYNLNHHTDWIYSLAFSLDGQTLISGSRDRTIQLWQIPTGERITGVRTSAEIADIALSGQGDHFAVVGYYSAIGQVLQTSDLGLVYPLQGHETRLRGVDFSSDGKYVGTGDKEGFLIIRSADDGIILQNVYFPHGEISDLVFIPFTQRVAVAGSDGMISIWDILTQSVPLTWQAHGSNVTTLEVTLDGKYIISAGGDGTVRIWDSQTGSRVASYLRHSSIVQDIAISASGKLLVSGGSDGRAIIWQTQ